MCMWINSEYSPSNLTIVPDQNFILIENLIQTIKNIGIYHCKHLIPL